MIQWTNQVHPEEEVSGGAHGQRELVFGSTVSEPDLEWDNLQQQAEWLQQDNCTLSSKLHNQEDNERKIRDLEEENARLKEQNRAIITENHDLKQKLSEFQTANEIKEKALRKLSMYKEEIEVLKPVLEEKRKLQEMTETLDAEKQREMLMRRQAEEMNTTLKKRLNDMNDQIQKFHALLDLKDSELKDLKGKNVKLQRKLQILSPIKHPQEDREDHCETENSRFKRRRLPECSRCHTGFPLSTPCCVHEKRPVRLQTGLLFWPCCGKQGRQEPEGCQTFKNHIFES